MTCEQHLPLHSKLVCLGAMWCLKNINSTHGCVSCVTTHHQYKQFSHLWKSLSVDLLLHFDCHLYDKRLFELIMHLTETCICVLFIVAVAAAWNKRDDGKMLWGKKSTTIPLGFTKTNYFHDDSACVLYNYKFSIILIASVIKSLQLFIHCFIFYFLRC